jgi:hypothetical protein
LTDINSDAVQSELLGALNRIAKPASCETKNPVKPRSVLCFITKALPTLIRIQYSTLKANLKHLAVLEIRFRRSNVEEEAVDWTRCFWTKAQLLSRIAEMTSHELGRLLTDGDQLKFRSISLESILIHDHHLQRLNLRWNKLCEAVTECAVAESHCMEELAKICSSWYLFLALTLSQTVVFARCDEPLFLDSCASRSARGRL